EKGWNKNFAELEEKRLKLANLAQQRPVIEEMEVALKRAERAGFIQPIENLYTEYQRAEQEKLVLLKRAQETEEEARNSLAEAESNFVKEAERKSEREQVSTELMELNHLLPQVKELDAKRTELDRLRTAALHSQKDLAEIESEWQRAVKDQQLAAAEMEELDQKLEDFDAKSGQLVELKERSRSLSQLITLEQENLKEALASEGKEAAYQKEAEVYHQLESQWLAGQASVLAASLHEGEACPVCGSTEHPDKHGASDSDRVSKEALDEAKKQLVQVERKYREAAATAIALESQISAKKKEVASLGLDFEQPNEELAKLKESLKQVEAEVKSLQNDKQAKRSKKEQSNGLLKQVQNLAADLSAMTSENHKRNNALETAQAIFDQQILSISEEMRDLKNLETHISQVIKTKESLERRWQAVQDARHAAKERLASATVSVRHEMDASAETKVKREGAEQQFTNALKKSSFISKEAYLQSILSDSKQAEFKEEINNFRQQHHTFTERISELEQLLKDRQQADLTTLEGELKELRQNYEAALTSLNLSNELQRKADDLLRKIIDAHEQMERAESEMNRLADLHDVIRGQNGLKLSFERYLQIEYLEQIIHSANERLKNLSNGQFHLMRSDRQEARGKQSGLGLDVYDAYTGQTRDVKTLSGGEKFNASLCLALGMADVIQSFQGNVSIDTMFIDEGFGSLDEESLNKSIETLIDLQKSGRMIGIISHVHELKAAIPAILEVKKSKEGHSKTYFSIK
ncbi:MAG TPA: SbcC/MukB-like Walker B domain-containing protein, partial [Planococcus sp. (in: firmicutes)]|nr:SbcC/MukB-like Walker B domain-containing protein [Planococcus sp. (in: firmicutes)]